MTSSKRATFALAILAGLATSTLALAQQPSAADLETARDLYRQGKELRAKGDLKGALEKLRAAHAVGRTPLTGIELARLEVQLGLLVEAREVCLGIGRTAVAPDESKRSADARTEAATLAESLKAKVATVVIKLVGIEQADHVVVAIDGVAIPEEANAEPRKVNPGKHDVSAKIEGGEETHAAVEVNAAETKEVSLTPVHPPKPVVTTPPDTGGPKTPPELPPYYAPKPSHGVSNAFAVVGFVGAGLGLIVGAITGAAALGKAVSLNCPNENCYGKDATDLEDGRTLAAVSTTSFVFFGAGLLTGTLALALRTSSPSTQRGFIRPHIGLGSLGVSGAF